MGLEEILAETYATKSLLEGLRHAFSGYYRTGLYKVTPITFGLEGIGIGGGVAGLGALGNGLGQRIWGE
jgi:hypothetical protein